MRRLYNLLSFLLVFTVAFGQTWTKLNLPKTDQSFSDIKLGQDGDLYLLTAMGLYSSSDDGDSWSVYDAGARNSDDKVADELMTITKDGLVFIDKALTINQTDGSTLKQTEYYTLGGYQRSAQMISLSTGEIIMAHRDNWGPKDVTYKISSDGGVTWMDKKASSSFALKNFKHPIFFVNDNDDVYYVGADYSLYRSTDKGESYTSSGTVAEWDEKLSTLDKKTGTFYIAFRMGLNWKLKKSSDHGATFTDIPLPSNEGITSILANDNKIVLSTNYNVRYSNDGGATWTDKSSMFIPSNFPEKFIYNGSGELMAMNANRSGVVLIDFSTNTVTPKVSGITQGSANSHHYNGTRLAASFSGYAYYSDDEGDTWTPLKGEGAYCGGVWVASDNTVYTASSKSGTWNGVYVQDANDSMIAVTADVESVWNMSKENTMFEDENGNIYCVSNTHGVYKSSDGKSFTKQSGAPFNSINSQIVWYDKGSKRMFGYVEGGGGHYYSDDYGVTWTDGSSITTEGFPQHTFIKGNSKMWAYLWSTKVANNGFYSSSDATNWNGPTATTENFDNRYDQFVKGNDDAQFFRASTKGFVQVSNDTGKTWTQYESGLDSFDVLDRVTETSNIVPVVRMTASGGNLILATRGSLYMANLDGGTTNSVSKAYNAELTAYPNPAHNKIHLKTQDKVISLSILDLYGKEILSDKSGSKALNVAHVVNGVYVLKVTTDKGEHSSRVIINH